MSKLNSSSYQPVSNEIKEHNTKNDLEDEEINDTLCGIGSFRPKWMQIFAHPLVFVINFSLVGIIQGMTGTYLVGSMSTLEKRFSFDSKVSGAIYIADNFSQMLVSKHYYILPCFWTRK